MLPSSGFLSVGIVLAAKDSSMDARVHPPTMESAAARRKPRLQQHLSTRLHQQHNTIGLQQDSNPVYFANFFSHPTVAETEITAGSLTREDNTLFRQSYGLGHHFGLSLS
jgi:hypothetical protein